MLADVAENLQASEAETLEGVRRSARLVGAAAEEMNAGGLELLGDGEALLFGFYGAGTGNDGKMRTADKDFAGGGGDADDGVFLFHIA